MIGTWPQNCQARPCATRVGKLILHKKKTAGEVKKKKVKVQGQCRRLRFIFSPKKSTSPAKYVVNNNVCKRNPLLGTQCRPFS